MKERPGNIDPRKKNSLPARLLIPVLMLLTGIVVCPAAADSAAFAPRMERTKSGGVTVLVPFSESTETDDIPGSTWKDSIPEIAETDSIPESTEADNIPESTETDSIPESTGADSIPENAGTESTYGDAEPAIGPDTQDSRSETVKSGGQDVVIGFAGDINLDENWATTKKLDERQQGIEGAFSQACISRMRAFDFFMVNNEFTYSTRGEPVEKTYHFRADPSRVSFLEEIGADLVLLANNHVFDYGEEALLDTLDTLENAGIPYVGAGRDLEEAEAPYVLEAGGRTIAFLGASQGERYESARHTRAASEGTPGVLECYDPEPFLEIIRESASKYDFVIVSVHWGLEYEEQYLEEQEDLAERMVDAGADAVIGTHPHCLEGAEFIGGAPVFYSLGNFWFNDRDLYSGIAELTIHIPESPQEELSLVKTRFLPCLQYGLFTSLSEEPGEKTQIWNHLSEISGDQVIFDEDGVMTPAYPDGTVSEESSPEEGGPAETDPEGSGSEETHPKESSPEENVPEETVYHLEAL